MQQAKTLMSGELVKNCKHTYIKTVVEAAYFIDKGYENLPPGADMENYRVSGFINKVVCLHCDKVLEEQEG